MSLFYSPERGTCISGSLDKGTSGHSEGDFSKFFDIITVSNNESHSRNRAQVRSRLSKRLFRDSASSSDYRLLSSNKYK